MHPKPDESWVVCDDTLIERKSDSLPRFVVLPDSALAGWGLEGTSVVEVTIDGRALGRRSLKAWPEREGWFFDLTERQAEEAGVRTGDRVSVSVRLASTEPPKELGDLLDGDPAARAAWRSLTDARRRMISEHVRDAVRSETRRRRARRALGLD